ncbi:MAG: 6-bladed beta-propeller [Thermodesulfovibrionia bacterium]|nr:6-bladed beta-propeller [Thermodesulfovibrionia bacterium]
MRTYKFMNPALFQKSGVNIQIILLLTAYCLLLIIAGCAAPTYKKPTGEYIWPPLPEKPRIKWITQWSNRYDFKAPNPLLSFFLGEDVADPMKRPTAVVADSAGNIYVADAENSIIVIFDIEKNTLRFIGEGILAGPVGLAVDNKRGIIFVADSRIDKVFGLDKNTGDLVMSIGAAKEFQNPSGMVFDEDRDKLYVTDTQNHLIRVFDKDGKALFTIGKRGDGDGEFNFPSYLALDREGRLFIADTLNFRVQVFDQEGRFLKKFGRLGDVSGTFTRPYGIGVDSEGHIYVVDTAFNNFQVFESDGTLLLWVGNAGTKPGEFFLPTGMYIDKQDRLYVADTFNHRVQVFQYLKEQK